MRKDEFNSDDHYTYYCGQESIRRNGVAFGTQERPRRLKPVSYRQERETQRVFCTQEGHTEPCSVSTSHWAHLRYAGQPPI